MMKVIEWLCVGVLLAFFSSSIHGCNNIPQPCDPEFVATQQAAMATACRINAEKTCPGYSNMSEDEKLQCPGVLECIEQIEKVETDCHDR